MTYNPVPHVASILHEAGIYTPTALTTGPTAMSTHMELWCASGSIKPAKRRSISFAYFDYSVVEYCVVVVVQEHAS